LLNLTGQQRCRIVDGCYLPQYYLKFLGIDLHMKFF
jgi:hypothetical protein